MLRAHPPLPETLHLHIGAHKTATTYIQSVLKLNAGRLRDEGVATILPDAARALSAEAFAIPAGRTLKGLMRIRRTRRATRHLFEEAGGARIHRVVLSEENVAGSCRRILHAGRLYPLLARRLAGMPRGLRRVDVTVHFAIRDYAPFFASCHSQAARRARTEPLPALDRATLAGLRRRWPDALADIRRALPNARIIAWRYEDFAALEDRVLGGLTGVRPDVLARPAERPMGALSGVAMRRLMAEEAKRGAALSKAEIRALWAEPGDRYDPWTSDERAGLARAYEQDCAALAADPHLTFLRP